MKSEKGEKRGRGVDRQQVRAEDAAGNQGDWTAS